MRKLLLISFVFVSTLSFGQSLPQYNYCALSGTDTYTGSISPTPNLVTGFKYQFKFANANTGASTITLTYVTVGSTSKAIKNGSSSLTGGEIDPTKFYWMTYDGTQFQIELGGGSGGGLTIGTTAITSGASGRVLYDNAGTLGEKTVTGTGDVVLATSPTLVTPALGAATATSINTVVLSGSSTPTLAVTGASTISGTHSGTSSGTNTGDQTTVTGNAGTATALQTARTIGIATGDVTSAGSSFDGTANNTNALTLATVNSNVGSFGSSTSIPSLTVNAKGLVTAASGNAVIAPAGTLSGTTLNSSVVTSSLTSVGTLGGLTVTAAPTFSAMTLGSALFAGTAGLLSQDNANYFYNSTTHQLGLGTISPLSRLTVTDQSSFQSPVTGSTAHFIGTDANPLRITFDTHNNSSTSGTALMFRRSRGTAATPLALSSGDVLGAVNFRGYGTSQYAAGSTVLLEAVANQAFTNANNGSALNIYTTPDNSVTAALAFKVGADKILTAPGYTTSNGILYTNGSGVISQATVGSLPGLGTNVGAWMIAPTWTNFNSAITGTAPYWPLTGTGTLTGSVSIVSNTQGQINFGGSWTPTGSNQYGVKVAQTIVGRASNPDYVRGTEISNSMTGGADSQNLFNLWLQPVMSSGGFLNVEKVPLGIAAPVNTSDGLLMKGFRSDGITEIINISASAQIRVGAGGATYGASTNGAPAFNGIGSLIAGSLSSANNTALEVAVGNTTNGATAKRGLHVGLITTGYSPSSGTGSLAGIDLDGVINTTTGTQTIYGLRIHYTETAVPTNNYGIVYEGTGNSVFGTTTPVAKLHVRGTGTTTGALFRLENSGGTAQVTVADNGATVFNNTVQLKGYTVATLPTGVTGMTAYVTDALAPTFGTTVTGGGAIVIPVFYNGSSWISY